MLARGGVIENQPTYPVETVTLSGARVLVLAILRRAIRDANSGNGQRADAIDFLRSPGCQELVEDVSISLGMCVTEALDDFLQTDGIR